MIFRTNDGPGMRSPAGEVIPQQQTYGPTAGSNYTPPPPAVPDGAVPVQGGGYQYPNHPQQQYGQHGYPMMQQQQVVVQQKRGVNHGLHFVLTVLTFGLWLPIWLIVAIAN